MTQLDLEAWMGERAQPAQPDTYAAEWATYRAAHPQVFAEFLRLARADLDRGANYISAKGVWEHLRRWCKVDRAGAFKLDNNHTRACADDARAVEPRLVGVMRTREASARKAA